MPIEDVEVVSGALGEIAVITGQVVDGQPTQEQDEAFFSLVASASLRILALEGRV